MKSCNFVFIIMLLIVSINLMAVPETINFQGALKDANGVPVNDTQFMEFRIYDPVNNILWSEQHLTVEIVDGIFSEELGTLTEFTPELFDFEELYITFFYGGEEMTPRQKLQSVPYALSAENTNLIEYVSLSGLVQQDVIGNATISGTMSAGSFVGDGSGLTNVGSFDDLYVNTTGPDTINAISSAPTLTLNNDIGDGVYVGNAGLNGIEVSNADFDGINVDNADMNGFAVNSAGLYGVFVGNASVGVAVNSTGLSGVLVGNAGLYGFCVANANAHGVYVGYARLDGVWVENTDANGVYVEYAYLDGVYANTTQTSQEWGLYTPDKINGCNITTRNQSTHVRYVGNEILESGDLVCIAGGYEEDVLGEDDELPVVNVTKANSSNSEAVLGVVEYKVYVREEIRELEDGKTNINKSLRYTEGSISNGDYLSVIVFGPVDVNVESNSNIKTGEKLTIADNGYARNINDDDNWRIGILGKALEDSNGRGKIKVYVNCR